jgi:hypothetical protein
VVILHIYLGILSLSLLNGLFYYNRLSKESRIISILVGVSFIIEWIGYYNQHISTDKRIKTIIFQIYSPAEAVLIGLFYWQILTNSTLKKLVLILTFSALIILCLDLVLNMDSNLQNFKIYLLPMIFYSLFSIFYLRQILDSNSDIISNSNFWFVTAILFFNTCFFFLSGFINFIAEKDLPLAKKLYSINHILNIIYYSLITYGFICQRRLVKSSL